MRMATMSHRHSNHRPGALRASLAVCLRFSSSRRPISCSILPQRFSVGTSDGTFLTHACMHGSYETPVCHRGIQNRAEDGVCVQHGVQAACQCQVARAVQTGRCQLPQ